VSSLSSSSVLTSNRTFDIISRLSQSDLESFPPPPRDFEDRRILTFRSGKGGDPAPNARRGQKKNGPGFGGHGGSVILRSCAQLESLAELPESNDISADPGGDGHGYSRGLHGRDKIIRVPLGTIIRERIRTDKKTPEGRSIHAPKFIYQFLTAGESFQVCEGGVGGLGPSTFKKGDGRKGTHGERKSIELELRLLSDCALIGAPNSGKTSIVSALTSANIRIGPEPYSTRRPHIGTLQFRDGLAIKIADLPGITYGDASDKQRGIRILRHMWRSKLLLYCVDMSSDIDAFEQLETLRKEILEFDQNRFPRKEFIIGTKCDMLQRDTLMKLDSLFYRVNSNIGPEVPVVGTSARFGLGVDRLVKTIRDTLYPTQLVLGSTPRFEPQQAAPDKLR
jgi:GTPase